MAEEWETVAPTGCDAQSMMLEDKFAFIRPAITRH